jgi:hypothetical protein
MILYIIMDYRFYFYQANICSLRYQHSRRNHHLIQLIYFLILNLSFYNLGSDWKYSKFPKIFQEGLTDFQSYLGFEWILINQHQNLPSSRVKEL